MSLAARSEFVKKGSDHPSAVLFTKYIMDKDKYVPVVNISLLRFVGGAIKPEMKGLI